jgi:N-acetylglutamate synthase-like GNAT family acetyltransferase
MPDSIQPDRKFLIRKATIDDAGAILHVHYEAVHKTAVHDYETDILNDWSSSLSEERLDQMKTQLSLNPEHTIMIVAELDGFVVGFGEIAPGNNELRAVYVLPTAGRVGIGKRILHHLEDLARSHGVDSLWLDSSTNAETFYAAHGYESTGRGTHELRSGRKMTCVKMGKRLSG